MGIKQSTIDSIKFSTGAALVEVTKFFQDEITNKYGFRHPVTIITMDWHDAGWVVEYRVEGETVIRTIKGEWEPEESEVAALKRRVAELERKNSGLKASRIAYANEFPCNEHGEPDVGNIHANLRMLKAEHNRLKTENRRLQITINSINALLNGRGEA